MRRSLEELLRRSGAVSEEQLREGRAHQRNRDLDLGAALVELGHVDEETVARLRARQHGLPFVDVGRGEVARAVLDSVPRELALEHGFLPVVLRGERLVIAVGDPLQRLLADQLSFALGRELDCAVAAPGALRAAIERYYGGAGAPAAEGAGRDEEAPVVRLVDRMLADALAQRASDVHLEPGGSALRVRLRVDGVLRTVAEHPLHLAAPLFSRLKVMGRMDIAERRKPQDGRIGVEVAGRSIDVRASILPSNHGETMVLRLLDRAAQPLRLAELGMDADEQAWLGRLIRRPHGIVLVTGPTGSGKTTTLYAALSELNRPDVKILTAEDPVEYQLRGVNQVQVQPRVGLTFARILRAMLRSAPDVILVGEIRDAETAEVAIQAALTGHLVFSTLHTNDAPGALTRLFDMGVAPFLVASALQGVVSQRLVRRLCAACAEPYEPDPAERRRLGPPVEGAAGPRRPRGCAACDGTGYRGRVGLFELLDFDAELREAAFRRAGLDELRALALARGRLRPLLHSGLRKVARGTTALAEVRRVARLEPARAAEA